MEMTPAQIDTIRERLISQKRDLEMRISRIHEHAREPLEADSSEQAAQLGNVAVVSALESEAVGEIAEIDAALQRLEHGRYGICVSCGEEISPQRLEARPACTECLDCAEIGGL